MAGSDQSDISSNLPNERTEELQWKHITVLLPDPRLEGYYAYWIPQDDVDLQQLKDSLSQMKGVREVKFYDDHCNMMKEWIENPPEFVFNQCDDGYMNREEFESHLTTFMDMLNIPYTGPGCDSLILVKDKSVVRGTAMSVGVPVPVEVFIDASDDIEASIPDNMVYPAFCKLGNSSGSVGVLSEGLAKNREEAVRGLKKLREEHPTRPLLLQEFLGGREFSIGMVGNPELGDFEVFHPVEVDYARLDPKYPPVQLEEFKRDGDSEFWQQVKEVKANLTEKQLKDIKEYARRMFIRTRCKDFARMDFRMDSQGQLKLMDVNPNCWLGGKYQMMAGWQGYSWPQILSKIVHTAQKRYAVQRQKQEDLKRRTLEKEKLELEKARLQGVTVDVHCP